MSDTEHHPERVDKSECEDHPERDTEENENEPTNFEWTPELVRIGTSLGDIHPSIGPLELHKDSAICKYRPGMTLPDPADTHEKFKQHAYAYNEILFPKIEKMLNMFIRGMHDDHDEF